MDSPLKEPTVVVCRYCGEDPADGCARDCPCDDCQQKREADLRSQTDTMNRLYYLASGGDHARMQREAEELARDCRAETNRVNQQSIDEINKARP